MENCSMFSKIFFEVVSNIDSRINEDLPVLKRELEAFSDGASPNLREGIQSKISLFFDCVRQQFQLLSERDKGFYQLLSDVVEAVGLILYQSVKKNRGINYPSKESLKKIIGDYKSNKPKANEKFALLLFPEDKKISITTISEAVGFVYVLLAIFNVNLGSIEDFVISELRQHVKIYVNNETFIKQVYNTTFNKWALVDKEIYDFSSVINRFATLLNTDDRHLMLCKLMFILLYFTDCKAPTNEAKDAFVQWVNNIQDEKLQIANGYSKYLWIRYRRLPEDELSAEFLNGFTIDNIYVLPNLGKKGAGSEKLLAGFFDKNSPTRKRRAIIGTYGSGKTALLNAIISMIAINSNYANADKNISSYFINYYSKIESMLGFKLLDVFPIIASCRKYDAFLSEWQKTSSAAPTLLDFIYYIIVSYSEELNVIGEKNEGWYEKWISTFTPQQFETIFKGALADDKVLLVIDDYEVISDANKKHFENMLSDLLHKYGSKCEIVLTATDESLLPEAITKIKNGIDVFELNDLDAKECEMLFSRLYAYFNNPALIQEKKNEITSLCDRGIEDANKKEQEFENYITSFCRGSQVLSQIKSSNKNPILRNPLVLCKLAALGGDANNLNIRTMDNALLGELLPAISNNSEIADQLGYILPQKLFNEIEAAKSEGNNSPLIKFQMALNKKSRYIKNQKTKQLLANCNKIINLLLEDN